MTNELLLLTETVKPNKETSNIRFESRAANSARGYRRDLNAEFPIDSYKYMDFSNKDDGELTLDNIQARKVA